MISAWSPGSLGSETDDLCDGEPGPFRKLSCASNHMTSAGPPHPGLHWALGEYFKDLLWELQEKVDRS